MIFNHMSYGFSYRMMLVSLLLLVAGAAVAAVTPEALLRQLNDYPHAQQVAHSEEEVRDHEIGLGAMQKVSGAWRFKNSERQSGLLSRHTWQIGREDLQRYRVYALQADDAEYRLVLYSSARTADRQYLHVDLLRIADL